MKIIQLNIKGSEKNNVETITGLKIQPSGIPGDFLSLSYSGAVPVLVIDTVNELLFSNAGASIILESNRLDEIRLMDTLESRNAKLEVIQTSENSKISDKGKFDNGLHFMLPSGGIFIRALQDSHLNTGDSLQLIPRIFSAKIITLSDRASKGIYQDLSGEIIGDCLKSFFNTWKRPITLSKNIIPDSAEILERHFRHALQEGFDLIFTTGGTGLGSRDITPETIRPLLEKEMNGIMDFIRMKYGARFPNALTSRSFAGVSGKSLVYCLPGSRKAVNEYMAEIIPTLKHSLYMVHDIKAH